MIHNNESDTRRLPVVDVTAIYAHPRTTGIQRVVRDIVGDGKEVRLVRYSPTHGGYVAVSALPELASRAEGRVVGAARKAVKSFAYRVWLGFGRVAATGWLRGPYSRLRKIASRAYSTFLSDAVLESPDEPVSEEKVDLFPDDALWLLDIPKTDKHLAFLKSVAASKQCSLGIYVYDMIPIDFPDMIGGPAAEDIKQGYLDYLELVPLASQVFFLSHYTQERYEEFAGNNGVKVPESKKVVYPPLDFSRYDTLKDADILDPDPEFARYLSAATTGSRILCVSPLNERKNVKVVLRALGRILEEGTDLIFLLVAPTLSAADAESVELVRKLTRRFPDNIVVINQISDEELVAAYMNTDIVVMPSVVEGFGLPIVEGLHFGCHVVVSDRTSFIELGARWPIETLPATDDLAWAESLRLLMDKPATRVNVEEDLPSPHEFRRMMSKLG